MRFFTRFWVCFCLFASPVIISGCLDDSNGNGTGTTTSTTSAPKISDLAPPVTGNCASSKIQLKHPDNTIIEFETIQSAINSAKSHDQVQVPSGTWNELVRIEKKEHLSILSSCMAQVTGFRVSKSEDVKIEGFRIVGTGSSGHGVELTGGETSNDGILITKNEITKVATGYNGIMIGSQAEGLQLSENFIHDNSGNGIFFVDSGSGEKDDEDHHDSSSNQDHDQPKSPPTDKGKGQKKSDKVDGSSVDGDHHSDQDSDDSKERHQITKNMIYHNGLNGVVIPKKQLTLLKGNTISSNGFLLASDDGYGIKRNGNAPFPPENTTLIDNVIVYNNGAKSSNSSIDISFYGRILDSTDSGNQTTDGLEGVGVAKFQDTKVPTLELLTADNILTRNPRFEVKALVADDSPVTVILKQNGLEISRTTQYEASFAAILAEGNNIFEITAVDRAGNQSLPANLSNIKLDTTPPVIARIKPLSDDIYTNILPISVEVIAFTNEPVSQATLNGNAIAISPDQKTLQTQIQLAAARSYGLTFTATDLAGNAGQLVSQVNLIFDNVAPVVAVGGVPSLTKDTQVQIPITVTDTFGTWTKVYVNQIEVLQTGAKQFAYAANLGIEGVNVIEVVSQDLAGNISEIARREITRDTTAPILSSLAPAVGSIIRSMQFAVAGVSNEPLSSVKVNGIEADMSTDKKNFSFSFVAQNQGSLQIRIDATDLIGNLSSVTLPVEIQSRLLVPSLVSIIPATDGNHLIVNGSAGASRPGAEIKVTTGILSFNQGTTTSRPDGSFQIELSPFASVTVISKDLQTGESEQTVISYNLLTKLSGIVKDTSGIPLVGVTIGIVGSSVTVVTDGSGAFTLTNIPSGDQSLYVDGRTAIVQTHDRQYSKTNIAVNIGVGQQNVLEQAVYLTPLMIDGTETTIALGTPATVQNSNAPGAQIYIPANSTSFPDGNPSGKINITFVPSDKTTVPVPKSAVPQQVLSLEPSGLSFNRRVELTLPNDNELPPKVEMIILSMNSKKGIWEVDGLATVSDSGNSIITKPGHGISHFSLVYAVPVHPVIMEASNPKLAGIDSSEGAMATGFSLPSYKSLGTTVTPQFLYKSSWAVPTAFVTNWFDIPKQVVTVQREYNFETSSYYRVSRTYCWDPFGLFCETDYKTFLIQLQRNIQQKGAAWYQPESIKSQFYVSTIASDTAEFAGSDQALIYNSPPDSLPGLQMKVSYPSNVYTYNGVPNQSVVSYAVELKNPVTNEYLSSGIYPTLARYQINLKSW